MNDEQLMCYITYAVPAAMLPPLPLMQQKSENPTLPDRNIFPDGFMPAWFLRGSFPEDDID